MYRTGSCIIITFKRQRNHIVINSLWIIIIWKFFQNNHYIAIISYIALFFPFFEHDMYDDVGTHQRKRNEGTIDPALLRWMQGSNIPMKTIITGKKYKSVRFINDFWFSVCILIFTKLVWTKENTKPLVFLFKKKIKNHEKLLQWAEQFLVT